MSCFDFSSDTGRFILFRLLLFHPWSARLAGSDLSQYTAAVIGELFDESGMPNMLLRPLADAWGHWSIRWAWRLGKAWREALPFVDEESIAVYFATTPIYFVCLQ